MTDVGKDSRAVAQQYFTVRDMPISERPRERLAKNGPEALNGAELLALILCRGTRNQPVTVMAQKLLNEFGDLKRVLSASPEQLAKTSGMGPAKAAQLKAVGEIARRLEDPEYIVSRHVVKGPDDVYREALLKLKGKQEERFLTILLNTRNHIIETFEVSKGNLDSSIVHPRETFKKAISRSAASMVLAHNHPSGDPEPSEEDIKLTRRLVQASEIVGIEVLDHLVVCDTCYVSMKAKGLL